MAPITCVGCNSTDHDTSVCPRAKKTTPKDSKLKANGGSKKKAPRLDVEQVVNKKVTGNGEDAGTSKVAEASRDAGSSKPKLTAESKKKSFGNDETLAGSEVIAVGHAKSAKSFKENSIKIYNCLSIKNLIIHDGKTVNSTKN